VGLFDSLLSLMDSLPEPYDVNQVIYADTLNAIIDAVNTELTYIGQPLLSSVNADETVLASHWASLYSKVTLLANHTGAGYTPLITPRVGDRIAHNYQLLSNINNIQAVRGSAAFQGRTVVHTATNAGRWYNSSIHTHTVVFASGDAAKNFFNNGGQLSMTFAHPNGLGIDNLFYSIANNMGTLILSAPGAGSVKIAGSSYSGLTTVGNAGSSATLLPNSGYYGLTTNDVEIYKKLGPYTYSSLFGNYGLSNVSVTARTNGTQGSNNDNGSTLVFTTTWDQIPNGIATSTNTSVSLTVRYPSSTYVTDTWGNVSVTYIVTSS